MSNTRTIKNWLDLSTKKRHQEIKTEHKSAKISKILSTAPEAKHLFDEFKQGDLVYGLAGASRKKVIAELKEKKFTYTFANALNCDVVGIVVHPNEHKFKRLNAIEQAHYNFLVSHRDYLIRTPCKPIDRSSDTQTSGAFRRACKLLLTNRSDDRQYRVHVIIDGIDWKRVLDKRDQGVTNSELRAAFRDFRRHGSNPHIFYYTSALMQTAPIWFDDTAAVEFDKYAKTFSK